LYTQCPECQIAFRVTALVLQQASGRVRCGGCGHAFSALDHLSESLPEPAADGLEVVTSDDFPSDTSNDDLPDDDNLAETSRRLLETLDELAGPSNVRIEDTGVEWRVLDEVVEDLDDDSPGVDSSETDDDSSAQESLKLHSEEKHVAMERRYDDNTPLDDDLDDESGEFLPPADTPKRRAEDNLQEDTSEVDAAQGDLALSEPGDWTGLLDDAAAADVIPLEVEEELAAIHDQLSSRASEATPEATPELTPVELNQPVDLDAQFDLQAEAMGLDITGSHDVSEEALTDEIPLLDESYDDSAEEEPQEEDSAEVESMAADSGEDEPEEEDSAKFVAIADDLSAEGPGDADSSQIDLIGDDPQENLIEPTGEFDANIGIAARALEDGEIEQWSETSAATGEDEEQDDALGEIDDDEVVEASDELEDKFKTDADSADEIGLADDAEEDEEISAEDAALIREIEAGEEPAMDDEAEPDDVTEHLVPPQTEAEMTVNMAIDAELLAAAAEKDKTEDEKTVVEAFGADVARQMFDENSTEVETIIMEGEFVRSAIDKERLAAENDARSQVDEYGKLADTYSLNRENLRGGRRRYDPSSYTVIAGVIILALVLIGQVMHGTRDSLATYGFFNQTMGPVYRMLGKPITPQWDIKGWRFESTSGSTDEDEEVLTVFSRLVNKSEQPLPFPLVHVSLTDRWEEIIGSRVLEPNEYLAGDLDPSKPVTPGENFTAVITIKNPSAEATGFKLNVCYRVTPGRVRCAIEDFKN